MAEDSWNAHIGYLEDKAKMLDERAQKLEEMIPDLKNEQKKHALRERVNALTVLHFAPVTSSETAAGRAVF